MPFLLLTLAASPALAGASAWYKTDGGGVRLVTSQVAGDRVKAALEIELKPGWKTYWRDPGDAGIAPSVSVPGAVVEIDYPVPRRFSDGVSSFAGYEQRGVLPLTIVGAPAQFEANAFLGICREICIPVAASLEVDASRATAAERGIVEAAFSSVPGPVDEDELQADVTIDGKTVTLATNVPAREEANAQLFVAAPSGWAFSPPKAAASHGRLSFAFDIVWKPETAETKGRTVPYVIVIDDVGKAGSFVLP
ncbi:MAG: hypothetical protein K5872_05445 [Rhizobiaceae bacterium]|nr:hypothetical protein [Rhizobiaceae bacterium]